MTRKAAVRAFGSFFTVDIVPVLKDNFSYIVTDLKTQAIGVVDVSEVQPLLQVLDSKPEWKAQLHHSPRAPLSILSTHKHWDHSGGNKDLVHKFPDVHVYGGATEPIPNLTHPMKHGDSFSLGSLKVDVILTPCHTSGHVLFHVYHPEDVANGAVFTGDTVFVGGVGAFFEGNSELMLEALKHFGHLPDPTCVYPGHEYTLGFIKFAASVVPKDSFVLSQLARYTELKEHGIPTVPSTVGEEKRQNVFLRVLDPEFRHMMGKNDEVQLMQHLYDTCP